MPAVEISNLMENYLYCLLMGVKLGNYWNNRNQPDGKARRKETIRRPRCRWVNNMKMYLKRDRMGWYGLAQSGSG
jgi:hypothetical protein